VLHHIPVSNNSWGGNFPSQLVADALTAARDAGHLFVAAAGNQASNNDASPFYPASFGAELGLDNVIAVAATDNQDERAYFSNFGLNKVDLGAPGVDVLSTLPTYGSPLGSQYGFLSGTSMATPHVAGAAALALSFVPGAPYLSLRQAILLSVDPNADLRIDGPTPVATGGRLNLLHMLEQFTSAGPVVLGSNPRDLPSSTRT
jgi:subtilisin family serine protease